MALYTGTLGFTLANVEGPTADPTPFSVVIPIFLESLAIKSDISFRSIPYVEKVGSYAPSLEFYQAAVPGGGSIALSGLFAADPTTASPATAAGAKKESRARAFAALKIVGQEYTPHPTSKPAGMYKMTLTVTDSTGESGAQTLTKNMYGAFCTGATLVAEQFGGCMLYRGTLVYKFKFMRNVAI